MANGIYQDLTNEDYIQYISNEEFYNKVVSGKADYKQMIDLIPSHAISNYAFSNNGDLTLLISQRNGVCRSPASAMAPLMLISIMMGTLTW